MCIFESLFFSANLLMSSFTLFIGPLISFVPRWRTTAPTKLLKVSADYITLKIKIKKLTTFAALKRVCKNRLCFATDGSARATTHSVSECKSL